MSRIFATANRRFFATNIVVSLRGKFAASLPGGEDRRQHRPPERPHLQRRDPSGRRPAPRRGDNISVPPAPPPARARPPPPPAAEKGGGGGGGAPGGGGDGGKPPPGDQKDLFPSPG